MTSLRILVVDDNAVLGMLLAEMLGEMGLDVCGIEATQTGAVEAALSLSPDLMIVDAQLAPGSGVAAMAAIQLHRAMPHIFMSGSRLLPNPLGVPVLLKPFSEESLSAAIGIVTAAAALRE